MKDKLALPPFWCPVDSLNDSVLLSTFASEKCRSSRHHLPCDDGMPYEETELLDVCSLIEDDSAVEVAKADELARPFAAFGSFRQRHGDIRFSSWSGRDGLSSEAPAKLGSGLCREGTRENLAAVKTSKANVSRSSEPKARPDFLSGQIDENPIFPDKKRHRRLKTQRSFSTDIDRDEAWERKRDLFLMDEPESAYQKDSSVVGRSVSDCGDRTWPQPSIHRTRTRSLTDEDLQELKGCIDLGFGFSYDESCDLKNTFPALELYYAINRQTVDARSRSSPVSPLEGVTLDRTSSGGSLNSPLSEPWRISSPGDHPSQVKTRLRHWAQAVACSVKQGFGL